MKKNIIKSIMAFSFIVLSLILASYLYEIKETAKQEAKKNQKQVLTKSYENDLEADFNLPIVIIDTNGNQLLRTEKSDVSIQIYDNEQDLNKLIDDPKLISKATIKVRGNSTSKYPKKQYSMKLLNNNGKEKYVKVLGMESNSDWVLNGPFADKSLMRNYIALKTGRNIMEYAPDAKFCEVFLIDDNSKNIQKKHYRGVYVMIEQIKRDDKRVDIIKSLDNLDETSFILAKDRQKEDDISLRSYGKETSIYHYGLNVVYPKNSITPGKYSYITKHITEFERILYSDKFNDPINGYSKYIDVESFIDYYIINEFFKNTDAGLFSTYIYKDYEEKIKAGPIWDFNKSMGNHNSDIGKEFDYTGFFMNQRPWFDRLVEDINFSTKLVNRYKDLRKTYISDEYLLNIIDETVDVIGNAQGRNFNKWSIKLCNQAELFEENQEVSKDFSSDTSNYERFLDENEHLLKNDDKKAQSFEEEILLMKKFIVERGKWMDENIDSLNKWAK